MLQSVTIGMLRRALRGKEISKEEGDDHLRPSSIMPLELVLFGSTFCVFFGVLCEIVICLTTYCAMGVSFSLIEENG